MKVSDILNSPTIFVEIGQSSLKALDANDGLELSLERLENGRLTPLCAERLTASLRVFLKKHSWRPRLRAVCAIGARGVSMRRLNVPARSSKDEFQRLLLLQIEREFPLPPEELAWGYQVLKSDYQNVDLLVVAVKKEVIEEYAAILTGAGLLPTFTLGALARRSICESAAASYALVDIGRSSSELVTFKDGVPDSIRILPHGGEQLTRAIEQRLGVTHAEAERLKIAGPQEPAGNGEAEDRLAAAIGPEVQSLAELLRTASGMEKVYLTGGGARLKDLPSRISPALGGVPCERIHTPEGEGRSTTIVGLERAFASQNGQVPLTLSVSPSALTVVRPATWKWAALAVLLAVGCFAMRYAEAFVQKPQAARRLAEMKAYGAALPSVERELSLLNYLKTNQPAYLDAISAVANAAAFGTRIDSFALNGRGDLSLRATMKDSQQVLQFRSKLVESGAFATVVVDEQAPGSDKQKLSVRISGQWKGASEPTVSQGQGAPPPTPPPENPTSTPSGSPPAPQPLAKSNAQPD